MAGAPIAAPIAASLLALAVALAPRSAGAGDETVRPGHWNRGKPPPGWVVVETQHYQVQSECGKPKGTALGAHLEAMLDLYERFLPMHRPLDAFVVKVFADRAQFLAYAGEARPPGSIAYYDPEQRELVAYDTGIVLGHRDIPAQIGLAVGVAARLTLSERQRLDPLFDTITDAWVADTARLLSHEGWHQYFHAYTVSVVPMPAWLDEGIGDWFSTATRDRDREATRGYRLGELNQLRLRALRRAQVEQQTVPFATMLGYAQEQYYLLPDASYAQGWAMVQFLMQHVVKADRQLIPRLIDDFKDSKNFAQSTAKVFAGIDLQAMDREFTEWAARQPLRDPMADLALQVGPRLHVTDFVADEHWLSALRWYVGHPEALAPLAGAAAAVSPADAPAADSAPAADAPPAPAGRDGPAPTPTDDGADAPHVPPTPGELPRA